jgi:hypothetical protein
MTAPRFTASRTTKNGKPAIELVVRNTTQKDHADFRALLDGLGYGHASGIDNARRIVCTTPEEIDSARTPIAKFFNAKGEWK